MLMAELMQVITFPSQSVTVTVDKAVPLMAYEGMLIGIKALADVPSAIGQFTPKPRPVGIDQEQLWVSIRAQKRVCKQEYSIELIMQGEDLNTKCTYIGRNPQ